MANNKLAEENLNSIAEGAPSFFAFFLLSIFIYVSAVFNLSDDLPALFSDTKFWFCISNALIFLIAADFGAFSPPPEQKSKQSENRAVKIVRERPESYRETRRGNSAKTYRRSKSEKAMEMERKIAMRRSKTMTIKLREEEEEASKEENEFEEMTDEELNQRVEEFIERFNRRIRLQELEYGDADGA